MHTRNIKENHNRDQNATVDSILMGGEIVNKYIIALDMLCGI